MTKTNYTIERKNGTILATTGEFKAPLLIGPGGFKAKLFRTVEGAQAWIARKGYPEGLAKVIEVAPLTFPENPEAAMATYDTLNGATLEFDAEEDRFYFPVQAILSQRFMDVDSRHDPMADDEDSQDMRRSAIDEWSVAVRNGFICC